MLTIIISIIISIILFSKFSTSELTTSELVFRVCLGFMVGAIIAFLLPANTKVETKVTYLENLQDNIHTEGRLFLGSGNIDGVWKYSYYVKRKDSYYLENIDAKGTPIKYTDGKPRIECTVKKISGWHWFAINFPSKPKKTIYIPEGSIQQNYNLDAR